MSKGMTWPMFYLRLVRDVGVIILFLLLLKISQVHGSKSLIYSSLIMNVIFLLIMHIVYNKKNIYNKTNYSLA